jgi:rubrerythrin
MFMSVTNTNLDTALACESRAYIKYRYFAKLAREEGFEEVAKHFERTAEHELLHAWSQLELLVGKPTTKECLELAIDSERYEFMTMYPSFENDAYLEQDIRATTEFQDQIAESNQQADKFNLMLARAEKRFNALMKISQRHARAHRDQLETHFNIRLEV